MKASPALLATLVEHLEAPLVNIAIDELPGCRVPFDIAASPRVANLAAWTDRPTTEAAPAVLDHLHHLLFVRFHDRKRYE